MRCLCREEKNNQRKTNQIADADVITFRANLESRDDAKPRVACNMLVQDDANVSVSAVTRENKNKAKTKE